MKKVIAWLICIVSILNLVGCKSNSKASSKIMEIVSGEWIQYSGEITENNKIILNDDYSAEAHGETCSWEIVSEDLEKNNKLLIEVKNSKKEVIDTLTISNNYTKQAEPDGTFSMISKKLLANLANTKEFDVIEINKSNYAEYFEIKDVFKAHKDDFGDYTDSFDFKRGWVLKDGLKVDSKKTNISYKCTYTVDNKEFEFNKETGDYKILNAVATYDDKYNAQNNFIVIEDGQFIGPVGTPQALKDSLNDRYLVNSYPTNISLEGITGTLFLYK